MVNIFILIINNGIIIIIITTDLCKMPKLASFVVVAIICFSQFSGISCIFFFLSSYVDISAAIFPHIPNSWLDLLFVLCRVEDMDVSEGLDANNVCNVLNTFLSLLKSFPSNLNVNFPYFGQKL